jgi:ABC-2 type transport system permease protein
MTFLVMMRKELSELSRTYRLLVLIAVLVAFGLMSPLLAKFTPELLRQLPGGEAIAAIIPPPTQIDAVTQFIKNTNQFGILLALLLSMGTVAQEKERGTAAMLLVKPMPRGVFLLAKTGTLGLVFLAATLLAGLGAYYYTWILFEPPDLLAWIGMTLLIWLELFVYIALTILFSTLVRSQAAAAGLAFGVVLLFALLGALPGLAKFLPGALRTWSASLFSSTPQPAWTAVAVCLGIILVALVAAWQIFERQEL